MLNQIVTSPVTRRNPPPIPKPPFEYAACSSAVKIDIPEARPMKRDPAEKFLRGMEEMLQNAATGLTGFRYAIAGSCSREDFENHYKRHIIENSLQVWLSPGEAGEIWAAMRAVKEE